MAPGTFQSKFDKWLDDALSRSIPPSVIAFSFNLAEPWSIEVIGSDQYSDDNPDWACEESFRPSIENFDLPENEVGTSWETVLSEVKSIVSAYLDRQSPGSDTLKNAVAVTVGFVDGDLHKVWPR